MSRREAGFSLVELLIAMLMFVFVIAASSQMFTAMLTQFKQQSKIAETNTEGIIGLEILRQDLDHAGYGLPWAIDAAVSYNEASADEALAFNDCSGTAPCNPPKAIVSGNNMTTYASPNNVFNGSDYLVIKATNIAVNDASSKWTYLRSDNIVKEWEPTVDRLEQSDRVIVLSITDTRTLVVDGTSFTTTYRADTDPDSLESANFAPADNTITRAVYGVDPDTNLRMPFNRADYYIWRGGATTATDEVPDRCAFGTGILRKAVIAHANGNRTPLPLLDCVADMQVVYCIDNDNDGDCQVGAAGSTDSYSNDITAQNAQWIRDRVREVRVYILAHEGQIDRDYTYPNATITVGEFGLGRDFNLSALTDGQNYRWKLYTIVTKPYNLR